MELATKLLFLGAPRAEHAGQSVQGFESRKAVALLGYLAAQAEAVPRTQLVALFWPDQPDERGRANLRHLLHTLATQLPGGLVVDRQTVRLARAPAGWIDMIAFEELAAQGTLAALDAAAALYRGPFLDGVSLDDCPEFETWLAQERERWHERIAHALTDLAARCRDQRAWDAGLRAVDRLLTLDPWREGAHQERMRLLALSGQRDSALAQYETCRRVLADELGLDPSPDTTALYDQIRDGMLAPAAAPAAQHFHIPIPPTPLLGRTEAIAQITELLAQPRCRLLTLLGPGGGGKTRLALDVATQQQAHFADGVYVVELAAIHDPALVAPTIVQILGVQKSGERSPVECLQEWLHNKHLLLYLDNFEQVLSAAPLVRDLLAHNARLKVLVTSRAPLQLRGEQEFPLGPLALPNQDEFSRPLVDGASFLAAHAATALFMERARSVNPQLTVTSTDAACIAAICSRLDGLPLAIELAAARSKVFSLPALLTRLERRLPLLKGNVQNRLPHQQTIRATIAWSYKLLTAQEQSLFTQVGVFVGGWTLQAFEAISTSTEAEPLDVIDGMSALVAHSLVRQQPGPDGEPRFSMLETIREFAVEQLHASVMAAPLRARHTAYYLHFAEHAAPELAGGAAQTTWFAHVAADLDNMRVVLRWALADGAASIVLRLAVALREFWMTRAYLLEGRQWLEAGLALADAADTVDAQLRAKALTTAGWLAANSRDFAAAERLLQASLGLARSLSDERQIIAALGDLGQAMRIKGDLEQATGLYREALTRSRALGDSRGVAWTLCNLGIIAHAQWHDTDAMTLLDEGMVVAHHVGDRICTAWCLTFLARVAKDHGRYQRSAALFAETLTIFRDVDHTDGIAFTLEGCAALAVACMNLPIAAGLFGAAEALRERINRVQPLYERDAVAAQIGSERRDWHAAWARGRVMSTAQAVELGLAIGSSHAMHYTKSG